MDRERASKGKSRLLPKQRELVERFIAAFNCIHQELRRQLGAGEEKTFAQAVKDYAKQYPAWKDGEQLNRFRELRNFVAHSQTQPHQHLAIPTLEVVESMKEIYERLSERVIPKFECKVATVNLNSTFADVLALIRENEFSQLPVYDEENQFHGLLTENGITRWLADHVFQEVPLIEFEEITVKTLLEKEEKRQSCLFISKETVVPMVINEFSQNPDLEAVLITSHGRADEPLLGIAAPWDILQLTQKA